MFRIFIKLFAVGICVAKDVSRKLHNGKLHAKAQSQIRNLVFPCVLDGADHALNTPVSKSSGNDNTLNAAQHLVHIVRADTLGVHPSDAHVCRVGHTRMLQRFYHTDIGIVK